MASTTTSVFAFISDGIDGWRETRRIQFSRGHRAEG
jgi:hypothetical protein